MNFVPFKAALHLAVFSLLVVGSVSIMFHITKDKIAANEYQALLSSLQQVLVAQTYDNDVVNSVLNRGNYKIYQAKQGNKVVAVILQTTTTEGYNGDIQLLIAFDYLGKLLGVEVLKHKETPGLGDKIERQKSDWLLSFQGKAVTMMQTSLWAVKRDGGEFEQFTGATITPRAIVNAVKRAGQFFSDNKEFLNESPSPNPLPLERALSYAD